VEAGPVLSDHERRRFDQIAGELSQDTNIVRLDKKAKAKASRVKKKRQHRTLVQWAEQRFEERMRQARGW
jgi:hypothetical protein